jgi:hypothetical protein
VFSFLVIGARDGTLKVGDGDGKPCCQRLAILRARNLVLVCPVARALPVVLTRRMAAPLHWYSPSPMARAPGVVLTVPMARAAPMALAHPLARAFYLVLATLLARAWCLVLALSLARTLSMELTPLVARASGLVLATLLANASICTPIQSG